MSNRPQGSAPGNGNLSDKVEYWWVSHNGDVQPAEIAFRNGMPSHVRVIGSRDIVAAASVELMDRLPAAPGALPVRMVDAPRPVREPTSPVWLVGIILLLLVYWFSGSIFDAIR